MGMEVGGPLHVVGGPYHEEEVLVPHNPFYQDNQRGAPLLRRGQNV